MTTLATASESVSPGWRDKAGLISLVAAEAVSNVGGRMTFLAIPWLVLVTTGSPLKVGIVTALETVAYIASGVLAAPLQDRIGPRLTSVGSDAVSVGMMAAIAFLGQLHFLVLVVLVTLAGGLRAQADRSKNNLLVTLMEDAGTNFTRVAAFREGVLKSATLLGASLGGVTIAVFGAVGAVLVDGVTFAFAAVVIGMIKIKKRPPLAEGEEAPPKREPYFTALRNGFSDFRKDRLIRAITGMLFFTNLFNQASSVVFIPLWVMAYMDDPTALGAVGAAYAVGLIVGNIVFAWLAPLLPRYPVLITGYFIGGAPRFLVLALSDDLTVVVIVTLVSGIAMCSVNPTIGATIYSRVSKDMLARVGGIITAVAFGGIPLGGITAGVLVHTLGLTNGILVATSLYFCVTLTPVVGYRLWRELNDLAPKKPEPGDAAALPQFYAFGGATAGPRITLRYSQGVWTMWARHGLRTVIPQTEVPPKMVVNALTQLGVEPVRAAVRQALEHDRVLAARQTRALRARTAETEEMLAEINRVLNHA